MTDISPIMIGSPETGLYKRQLRPLSIFDRSLIVPAIRASFRKLDPRTLAKNPVMFCVEIVSVLTTIFFLRDLIVGSGTVVGTNALFSGQITVWLWFTVLFANFAEAVAEGRGKAQADALRRAQTETKAKRLQAANSRNFELVDATALKAGDLVLVWSPVTARSSRVSPRSTSRRSRVNLHLLSGRAAATARRSPEARGLLPTG